MERRSAEIAERRLAREQRREAKMRERAEQLAREEEEQRKVEAAMKEAKLKQKREERQLVKQVPHTMLQPSSGETCLYTGTIFADRGKEWLSCALF